ncbi:MAG: hypothetical protein Q7U16_10455 [Agitococcus sp.]|nr:hypothetical protein [Agitococcus sp.]
MPITIKGVSGLNKACSNPQSDLSPKLELNQPKDDELYTFIGFFKRINPLLPELAANLQHPLWPEIDQYVQSQKVFEWPQFLQHHSLLTSAVFRLSDDSEFLIQLVACGMPIELIAYSDWMKAVKACQNFWMDLLGDSDAEEMARLYIKERIQTIVQIAPSLTTMMAWIEYQMWGELPESVLGVALAKSQDAYSLVDQLWQGENSLLQTILLRTHDSGDVWPTSKVFIKALNAFYKKLPKNILHILDHSNSDQSRMLFWPLTSDYKYAVVNLPVLCGFWSMSSVPMAWWSNHPERQRFIQQLLNFDPIWFQVAYNQGCKLALALDVHSEFNRE